MDAPNLNRIKMSLLYTRTHIRKIKSSFLDLPTHIYGLFDCEERNKVNKGRREII